MRPRSLKDLVRVKLDDKNADFWIERRGSRRTVGKPSHEYGPHRFGVTVTARDALLPEYLFYMLEHIWNQGYFEACATGSTNLVNIRARDILDIPVG